MLFSETWVAMKFISVLLTAISQGSTESITDDEIRTTYEGISKSVENVNILDKKWRILILSLVKIFVFGLVQRNDSDMQIGSSRISFSYHPHLIFKIFVSLFEEIEEENYCHMDEDTQNLFNKLQLRLVGDTITDVKME